MKNPRSMIAPGLASLAAAGALLLAAVPAGAAPAIPGPSGSPAAGSADIADLPDLPGLPGMPGGDAAGGPPAEFPGLPVSSSDLPGLGALGGGEPLSRVDHVDLAGYAGTWHQLAAVPQPFTLQCARDVTAVYTVQAADRVGVRNTCVDWAGESSGITGRATVQDPATNAALRVSFDGVPFQDPEGEANYIITYLADDVAIVGGPERTSGFVLARGTALSPGRWAEITEIIADRGWSPCLFLTTPTTGGEERTLPLCAI
ncbi:lipocalin family protein [Corynebacterium sphenisci]|uniref:lipocalin family protein n=1 Tax=Corynebacterium sphenisci TaxID=191493 RepID=UPI0026E02A3A|nr:lipocalin family protein [Corynebacterium sphenisci]MDO5731013.1 lipocalin family protein [Corynebacterium sphenisci]